LPLCRIREVTEESGRRRFLEPLDRESRDQVTEDQRTMRAAESARSVHCLPAGHRSSISFIIISAHLTVSKTALTVAGTFRTPSRSPHAGQDVYWATSLRTIGLQEKTSRAFSCLEVYVAHKMLLGVLAITLGAMTLQSYGQAVTANVLRRTLLIKVASGYGTAFTIEVRSLVQSRPEPLPILAGRHNDT